MLRPMPSGPIPSETARVARAAFPKGNRYVRVADALETLFTDDAVLARFPTHGQPAHPPWRLALVTILQFAEGLSDRQAANAVRRRIDWQDVRHLELTDPGFDAAVLSECPARLIAGAAALTPSTSKSIGPSSERSVRPARPVSAGRPLWITVIIRSSR